MPVPIPPKVLQNLTAFVKSNISDDVLEQGYALFRQPDSVELIHAGNDMIVATCIDGPDNFDVEISPEDPVEISCSCGGTLCRHGLTVLLHLLRLAARNPEMFLAECSIALNERARREKQKPLTPASTHVLTKDQPGIRKTSHKPAKRKAGPAFPQPDDSATMWRSYFHDRFGKALVTPRPSAYLYGLDSVIAPFYYSVMEEMADESDAWPATLRGLFTLHAQLYAMEAIDRYYASLPFNPGHYSGFKQMGELAQSAYEHTEEIFSILDMNEVLNLHAKVWQDALDILRQNTFKANASRQDWSGLYRVVWSRIYILGNLAAEERAQLYNLFDQAGSQNVEACLRSSLALFDFLGGDDEAALVKLKTDPALARKGYEPFLNELYRYGVWSRLLVWLEGLSSHLKRDRYFLDQIIFPLWLEAAEAQPGEPGWLTWIKGMLPQSRGVYISYLIRNGEARKVAHMLLSEGHPLYFIDKKILKLLEKADLRLVLPLYHQDAERYILEKNRQSYKQAVRLLKKLAGFYKKLKEQDRWQAYIGQLADRHSRLRAFQEELRKGKLIL